MFQVLASLFVFARKPGTNLGNGQAFPCPQIDFFQSFYSDDGSGRSAADQGSSLHSPLQRGRENAAELDMAQTSVQGLSLADADLVERQISLAKEAAISGLIDLAVTNEINQGLH